MQENTPENLSPIQKSVMETLWELGEGTVHQVLAHLPEPKPPYTSVLSALQKLKRIGWVSHRTEGRQFVYIPHSPDQIDRQTLRQVIDRLFGRKSLQLFQHLLEEETLTPEELAELRRLIDEYDARRNDNA